MTDSEKLVIETKMKYNYRWNIRCGDCGKFISEKDVNEGKAIIDYSIYVDYWGEEAYQNDNLCAKCNKKRSNL